LILVPGPSLWLRGDQNGHDNTVNSYSFTENNTKKTNKLEIFHSCTYEIKFYELILGVLIEEALMVEPAMSIPAPDPIIEKPMPIAIPMELHEFGSVHSKTSDHPL
jgi:hypothetical protein